MAKTPISVLQEHCVKSFVPMPIYVHEDRTIPSTPCVFACRCTCAGKTVETLASSKKVAKQKVAEMMLRELRVPNQGALSPEVQIPIASISSSPENYIGKLNEYCSKNGYSYPSYLELGSVEGVFQIKCSHQSLVSTGMSTNKKDAKQKAANGMLAMLGKTDSTNKQETIQTKKSVCREYTDAEIIDMYQKITLSNNLRIKSETPVIKDPFAGEPKEKFVVPKEEPEEKYVMPKRVLQTEKYARLVRDYDPKYSIEQVGSSPYVLVFTLSSDKNFVLMEMGADREEVEELLLSKVCEKLKLEV